MAVQVSTDDYDSLVPDVLFRDFLPLYTVIQLIMHVFTRTCNDIGSSLPRVIIGFYRFGH